MLNIGWIIAVAIALGADAFSLALAIGLAGVGKRMAFRLSLTVAVFHIVMPLTGLWVGQTLGEAFGRVAQGIGALVLLWLGGKMIWNAYAKRTDKEESLPGQLPAGVSLKGWGIYALGFSVSLDALSVGFSLGTASTPIGWTIFIMGVVAGLMTAAGLLLGRFLGVRIGERAEALGGLTLVLIGIRLFF